MIRISTLIRAGNTYRGKFVLSVQEKAQMLSVSLNWKSLDMFYLLTYHSNVSAWGELTYFSNFNVLRFSR
jgi:hypothetical protein